MTPLSVLGIWVRGLLAIVLLAASGYLLYRWQEQLPTEAVVEIDAADGQPPRTEVHELRSFTERFEAWEPDWDSTTAYLATGTLLLVFSLGGQFMISPRWLRRRGSDEPRAMRTGEVHRIKRPDGAELHVECYGPKGAPLIVLTHGWGCDSTQWYYAKRHLADRYRLIVWDLPGLGQSSGPKNNDYSVDRMAGYLRAVLDLAGEQPALLVGHSIGGMINLTFCRLFPELLGDRVSGLVIANSTPTNPLKTMLFGRLWTALQKPLIEPLCYLTIGLSPLVWLMNCLSYINGSVHWSTELESFAGGETRGQLDFAARYMVKMPPAVGARGVLGMLRYDATDVLSQIDIPVLVIASDRDPVTKPDASRWMQDNIPDSRLSILRPAKHLGLLEHSAEFLRLVDEFTARVVKGRQKMPARTSRGIEPVAIKHAPNS